MARVGGTASQHYPFFHGNIAIIFGRLFPKTAGTSPTASFSG